MNSGTFLDCACCWCWTQLDYREVGREAPV